MSDMQAALAVGSVAAATAAAVVIPLTLTVSHAGGGRAFVPTPDRNASLGGQVIGFHGMVLTVPASWHINDTRCGAPAADTVIRDPGEAELCLEVNPPHVSSVRLLDNPGDWTRQIRDVHQARNANGVALRQGHSPGHDVAVVVPAAGVLVFVDGAAVTRQRIIDSIDVVAADTTGCLMHDTSFRSTFSFVSPGDITPDPRRHAVVPPTPTAIAVCHYRASWLVSSATVTASTMDEIVRQADTAPSGWAHAPTADYLPSVCTGPPAAGGEAGSGFVLLARYADGAEFRLSAHIGFCGRLGLTNGVRSARLTLALAKAITAPLHTGFAIPGRLLPGPG